jgi:hypothetical protein
MDSQGLLKLCVASQVRRLKQQRAKTIGYPAQLSVLCRRRSYHRFHFRRLGGICDQPVCAQLICKRGQLHFVTADQSQLCTVCGKPPS